MYCSVLCSYSNAEQPINVCNTYCHGGEDKLAECYLSTFSCAYCRDGVVGINCSKLVTPTGLHLVTCDSTANMSMPLPTITFPPTRTLPPLPPTRTLPPTRALPPIKTFLPTRILPPTRTFPPTRTLAPTGTDTVTPAVQGLTTGAIIAIVISVLVFTAMIAAAVILCSCCFIASCPYYYGSSSSTYDYTQLNEQCAQVIVKVRNGNYQPPPSSYV